MNIDIRAIAQKLLADIDREETEFPLYLEGMRNGVKHFFEALATEVRLQSSQQSGGAPEVGAQQAGAGDEAVGSPDPGTGSGLPPSD
jgi:hypothetical protein